MQGLYEELTPACRFTGWKGPLRPQRGYLMNPHTLALKSLNKSDLVSLPSIREPTFPEETALLLSFRD